MERNICNVIWVDNDIDDICPEFGLGGLKQDLKKYNIEVIGKAHSFIEFEERMKICKDRVDAVITDANFNDTSRTVDRDDDFKGLIKMIGVIDSYNKSRDIPFYLYSGKDEYFKFYNGELDYFDINKRRFKKGDYEKMFKRIKHHRQPRPEECAPCARPRPLRLGEGEGAYPRAPRGAQDAWRSEVAYPLSLWPSRSG